MTDKIKTAIKEKRDTLSPTSIKSYASTLKSLYEKVFNDKDYDLSKFKDTDKVIKFLDDMPPNRRKTILSALVVITDDKDYRNLMLGDIRDYNKEIHKQEKTETQKENWVNGDEIKQLWEDLKTETDLIYKKKNLKPADLQEIQSFIILSLLGGIFIPPRRSLDYCDFVIKGDRDKKNYLDKNELVFNHYKTSKYYGEQRLTIPKQLKTILTKWISVNPTNYLLFDRNLAPLNSVKLNQRFNKMFGGKKVAINAMRHTFLTEKYKKHSEEQKAIDSDMTDMGSSGNMSDTYIKLK
jgi:integrase